jgi:hypothetical protein
LSAESKALKDTGNKEFAAGEFENSAGTYGSALELLPNKETFEEYYKFRKDREFELPEEPLKYDRAVLHGNLSAAQKHLEKYEDSIKNATESLRLKVILSFNLNPCEHNTYI